MKPIALFCLALIIKSAFVFGQLSVGVTSGLNLSTVKFHNLYFSGDQLKEGIRPDYFIGISPKYEIFDNFSILLGIQYSRKGYDVINVGLRDSKSRYDYIDIVPEVGYNVFQFLCIRLGINYGYLLKEYLKIGNTWSELRFRGTIQELDFGVLGTVSGEYKNLYIFFRYNHGLRNISNFYYTDSEGNLIYKQKQYNKNFQIGLGYTFHLGKE